MRVLVLGGTGVFGSRLCRLLAGDPGPTLTIAARDRAAVDALARDLGVIGRAFDWRRELDGVLGEGGHDVVVHAAGPFQGQDYSVAECCIRHGVHYLDLADDAAFVQGIDRLHDAALDAGVLGAVRAPAPCPLSRARSSRRGLKLVRSSASPSASCRATTRRAGRPWSLTILGGVGKPIAAQPGRRVWGTLRRMRLTGLGRRWVAPCDLPEPALFARRFVIHDTFAGAGLEVSLFHVGLWSLSWLVRLGLVRTLTPAAPLLAWGHRRPAALPRHRPRRPAAGIAGRLDQPCVVPDRRGRRRSLHPSDTGRGIGAQACRRTFHVRSHALSRHC